MVAGAGIDRWNRFDPLRSDPSHQAPPLRSFAARSRSCIAACICAMFRYRLEPSRPGRSECSFPLLGSAALMGFWRPSQACSRDGWPGISVRPGPRACSSSHTPRLIFVGSICRRLRNDKSKVWRHIARAIGLASGLRSRLRSVSPRVRQTAMSASTLEDRSCLGLCLLQGFRARTCAFGRARPRPDHPTPRAFLMPFIRSWAYIRL